jgi:HEPN domain-containing protein
MKQKGELNVYIWIEKAHDDELTCLSLLTHRDAPPTSVCFIAQQMAEKHMKALYIFFGEELHKIHDLKKLATILEKHVSNIFDLEEEFNILNKYYTTTRYPGDFPEGFSWHDAEEAFKAATRIKEFVLEKIKN